MKQLASCRREATTCNTILSVHAVTVTESNLLSVPLWLKASRRKLAAKAVELGGSRLLLKEKKLSPGRYA